jgi:hypothetical protein
LFVHERIIVLARRRERVTAAGGRDPPINGRIEHPKLTAMLVRPSAPRIVIVQARPYDVTWSADRLWLDEDGDPVSP